MNFLLNGDAIVLPNTISVTLHKLYHLWWRCFACSSYKQLFQHDIADLKNSCNDLYIKNIIVHLFVTTWPTAVRRLPHCFD